MLRSVKGSLRESGSRKEPFTTLAADLTQGSPRSRQLERRSNAAPSTLRIAVTTPHAALLKNPMCPLWTIPVWSRAHERYQSAGERRRSALRWQRISELRCPA
ncbi:hypothetical protein GCM10027360_87650 [Amycolatopsis echigonensis]